MANLRWATWGLVILCCGCRAASTAALSTRSPHVAAPTEIAGKGTRSATDRDEGDQGIKLASAEVDQQPTEPGAASSPSAMSLPQCIALGLSQNPDLIALRETENVGTAVLGVAQTYPFNPYVQVQATPYQNATLDDHGTTYHYVLLMQTIQLAHQQQFREEGAASTLNSTRWNIHQAELQNVAQTERLYFNVLYLRGILDLAKASDQNNQDLLRTLEKQLDAGQATAAEVAIVRVDARSTKQQVRLATANYETALRDLKRQLGVAPDDPMQFEGDLRLLKWKDSLIAPIDNEQLSVIQAPVVADQNSSQIANRAAIRPDVMAARSDVDAARAAQCLATASKTPDLQIGPYYQRTADGMTYMGFRAQMDLPVVNSGRPLEQQRIAEFNQRVTTWQQLQRRAELEAMAAWERYQLAQAALAEDASFGASDLPTELESLEQQFLAGEVDVVRVVQARTSIIQNQRVRLDLLNELAQSAASLTATAAIPLEDLLISN
jgi:cobalt-zinc-cadmium efflux system outer membrane protein